MSTSVVDQFRVLVKHLLNLRTSDGNAVVSWALFFAEIREDIEDRAGFSGKVYTVEDVFSTALGEQKIYGNDLDIIYGQIELKYRRMVCGLGQLDWLCDRPGGKLLLRSIPLFVTDHETGMEYRYLPDELRKKWGSRWKI